MVHLQDVNIIARLMRVDLLTDQHQSSMCRRHRSIDADDGLGGQWTGAALSAAGYILIYFVYIYLAFLISFITFYDYGCTAASGHIGDSGRSNP